LLTSFAGPSVMARIRMGYSVSPVT